MKILIHLNHDFICKKKIESKKEIIFFKDLFSSTWSSSIWSLTIFQVQIKLANLWLLFINFTKLQINNENKFYFSKNIPIFDSKKFFFFFQIFIFFLSSCEIVILLWIKNTIFLKVFCSLICITLKNMPYNLPVPCLLPFIESMSSLYIALNTVDAFISFLIEKFYLIS